MKWKKAYNYYLGSSLLMLALLLAMGILVMYPAWHKIVTIKREIAAEKENLEKKLDLGLNANKIKEDLKSIEDKLSVLETVYISQNNELTLLSRIESIAAQNKIEVTLKPDFNGIKTGNTIRTPLVIVASGNFKNIMSFLNGLDSTDFFFIADQINLTKKSGDTLALDIAGQVYIKTADTK